MSKVRLVSITPNYNELIKLACSKPYGNDVSDKGVQAIIKSGHLSVLEHCYASFEVECSCRVLGQITRHRHLSFTVKSLRGSEGSKFVLPESLNIKPEDVEETYKEIYEIAKASDVPLEDVAYMLPQGTMTAMVITGNFRAWYEYLPKRLCARALKEHRDVAFGIKDELAKYAPEFFKRDFMNCTNCQERSCKFK